MSEVASQSAQGPSTNDRVHEDLVNKMSFKYLKNVDDYDERLTGGWKDDANGVLVFTGLFSTIVASFIIESYKLLSPPDSGSQSAFLLGQLSQQFAGFANGTHVQPQSYPSSRPSTSIICVNILWLLSFLLSTTSALFATLMLQWARIFIDLPQTSSVPKERGRVRSVLFFGMEKYHMHVAVETAPTLLHLSVFLFFIGLVIFFFTIYKTVAIVISIAVGLFGLAYFALTILPCLDHSCPYRTPMSNVWWYLQHTMFSAAASCCRLVVELFRNRSGPDLDARPGRLSNWSEFLKHNIEANKLHVKDGLSGNIFQHVKTTPVDLDLKALNWLLQLPILGDKGELEVFVDNMPPQILVQLSSLEAESRKKTIRDHLFDLFQGCLGNKDKLEETERTRRLQICLDAFYQIVKPSSLPGSDPKMALQYVWSNFKDLDPVRKLWDDSDPAIRISSLSICAHISRNILRKSRPDNSERSWLREFVGKKPEDAIFDPQLPNHLPTWDHFILESFVFGAFPCLKDGHFVKPEHAACFEETLAVLLNASDSGALSKDIFSEEIFPFIEWTMESDHEDHDEVAAKLDQLFSKFVTEPTMNINDQAE